VQVGIRSLNKAALLTGYRIGFMLALHRSGQRKFVFG